MTESCPHARVNAEVDVAHLEDAHRWQADVRLRCADCGLPFRFIGLPVGLDLGGATVSVDGTEARLAVAPKGEVLTPLDPRHASGFTVRRTA